MMSLHDDIKFKFLHENRKNTFSLHSNSTFGCLGIKLGKCREPWSPDPRLIEAQVKGYLVLPLPQNAHVTNALIHPERRW